MVLMNRIPSRDALKYIIPINFSKTVSTEGMLPQENIPHKEHLTVVASLSRFYFAFVTITSWLSGYAS